MTSKTATPATTSKTEQQQKQQTQQQTQQQHKQTAKQTGTTTTPVETVMQRQEELAALRRKEKELREQQRREQEAAKQERAKAREAAAKARAEQEARTPKRGSWEEVQARPIPLGDISYLARRARQRMAVGGEDLDAAVDAVLAAARLVLVEHIRTVPAEQDDHPSVKAQRKRQQAAAEEKEQRAPQA